jgi:hypothetical protein
VKWNHQNDQRKERELKKCLERMKCKGSEDRRLPALVVDAMHDPKHFWPMHPTMEPIVVSFVQDEQKSRTDDEVP